MGKGYTVIWNVPFHNENFVGRKTELEKIKEQFSGVGNGSKVVCLQGLQGMGKSQTAKKFAHENKESYTLVWWIRGAQAQESYRELANKLEIKTDNLSFLEIRSAVKEKLRVRPDWLLIFDELEMMEDFNEYFPEQHTNGKGHILITTTNSALWPKSMKLGPLEIEEAEQYLLQITQQNDPQGAKALAERLGCFPLALAYAASVINTCENTFVEYLKSYHVIQSKIFNFDLSVADAYTDYYKKTVQAVFTLLYEKIKGNLAACDLLFFCSFLNSDNIPKFLLESFLQEKKYDFNDTLAVVIRHTVLQRDKIYVAKKYDSFVLRDSYSLHRLMQEFIAEQIDATIKPKWITTCLELICRDFKPQKDDLFAWQRANELIFHLDTVLTWSEKIFIPDQRFLRKASIDSLEYSVARDLISLSQRSLSRLKNGYIATLDYSNCSDVNFYARYLIFWVQLCISSRAKANEYQEAIEAIRHSFAKNYWKILIDDTVVQDLNYFLSLALLEVKEFDESEFLLKKVLKLSWFKRNAEQELDCLCNLGTIYKNKGQFNSALEYFTYALILHEKADYKFPDMGYVYNAMGAIYRDEKYAGYSLQNAKECFFNSVRESERFTHITKAARYAGWAHYGLAIILCEENNHGDAEIHMSEFQKRMNLLFPDKWPYSYVECFDDLKGKFRKIHVETATASSYVLATAHLSVLQVKCDSIFDYLKKVGQLISSLLPKLKQLSIAESKSLFWLEQQVKTIEELEKVINGRLKNKNASEIRSSDLYKFVISNIEALKFRMEYLFGESSLVREMRMQLKLLVDEGITLLQKYFPSTQLLPKVDYSQERKRYQEQCRLEASADFRKFLVNLGNYAVEEQLRSKIVFISYAWPVNNVHEEEWTKHFVWLLTKHLVAAGLMVYTDQLQSGAGNSLHGFMNEKIEKADHILVICDRTMNYKFVEDGFSGVCYEYLRYIDCYRRERKQRFIIPICLNEKGYMPGLVGLFAEVSVYKEGYLSALKDLIKNMYGFGEAFEGWWQKNLPNLSLDSTYNQHGFLASPPPAASNTDLVPSPTVANTF